MCDLVLPKSIYFGENLFRDMNFLVQFITFPNGYRIKFHVLFYLFTQLKQVPLLITLHVGHINHERNVQKTSFHAIES